MKLAIVQYANRATQGLIVLYKDCFAPRNDAL